MLALKFYANDVGRLKAGHRVAVFNPYCQQGLTLIEMLVALVLSSIIFVSAFQIISNLVQYQSRARMHDSAQLDRLLVVNLISQIIEMGINQYDLSYRSEKSTLFQGKADAMQLVSRAYSERYDHPGHRVYRLYEQNGELFVSHQAFDKNFLSNRRFELGTGLKINGLKFEYFEDGDWTEEWGSKNTIPDYIRVRVDFPEQSRIEWIRATSRR